MKISKVCKGVSPSMTLAITSKAKQLKAKGLDVISFGVGEPDFDTPVHIRDAAKKALDMGLTRYTPAAGTPDLKAAIVETLKTRNLSYEPAQIVVSNGAKHSLFNAITAIIDDGDEVLLPAPFWVSYPELIKIAGGTVVEVPCDENFIVDTKAMAGLINEKTRAIILNNPCNPTGAVYQADILQEIAALCVKHDIYVISDEIYDQLVYDGQTPPSISTYKGMYERTIVINGVSKSYAMTGWRIGYLAAPIEVAKAVSALQSQVTSGPNSIAQYASVTALNGPQEMVGEMKAEFKRRRDFAVDRINNMDGASCPIPGGAFYIMMNISSTFGKAYKDGVISSSMDFANALLEDELVAVVPGVAFGADEFVRLSYATSMENLSNGLDRIEQFIQKL